MRTNLNPYPAYKPSGVLWLGDVPEHWDLVRLKHAVQINPETLSEDTDPEYLFDYMDINSVGTGYMSTPPVRQVFGNAPSRARRVVRQGDTAISTVRTYLKAAYHLERDWPHLVASTGFAVLRSPKTTVPALLGHVVQSDAFVRQVVANSVGVAYPAISETRLGTLFLVLPTLPEQTAIVRYLNHADRRIRRYVSAKRKLIALLEEEKQAVVNRAVTRGLDPNVRPKPSGVEWLGDVPEPWEVRRAKFFYREADERSTTGTEELMSVSHITGVTPRKKSVTMFLAESNMGYKLCRLGDIVINTMWAYMAALGVARQNGLVSPSYGVYRPLNTECLSHDYVDSLLRTEAYRMNYLIRSTGITSSRLRLYPESFLDIPLLCPPSIEQTAIVEYLERATAATNGDIERARRQVELMQEYRTRLIADVVTGKLDVREAAAQLPNETDDQDPMEKGDLLTDGIAEGLYDAEESAEELAIESEVTV